MFWPCGAQSGPILKRRHLYVAQNSGSRGYRILSSSSSSVSNHNVYIYLHALEESKELNKILPAVIVLTFIAIVQGAFEHGYFEVFLLLIFRPATEKSPVNVTMFSLYFFYKYCKVFGRNSLPLGFVFEREQRFRCLHVSLRLHRL